MNKGTNNRINSADAGKSPDPREVYADIIDLPHHQSHTRPHMSLYDRSAQFAAYKALSGYEEMVEEEARLTDMQQALDDCELRELDGQLKKLDEMTKKGLRPTVTFTVFIPDEKKAGGRYDEITDRVKKIDQTGRKAVLESTTPVGKVNKAIDFERIASIRII